MDADHINRIETSKADPVNSNRDNSIMVLRNKKARTGVLPSHKQHGKKTPKRHGKHCYCMLWNMTGMPDRKYKSHISRNWFGKISDQQYVKDGLGGALVNKADSIKHYKKSEQKWKMYLRSLKKQNKMIFSMAKKSGSRRYIKEIKVKSSKKCSYYSSNISSNDSDSGSSLSSDSER